MADFSLGSGGYGRLESFVNWNNSYQASFHYKLSVITYNGWYDVSGAANWNGNISGQGGASGNFTYNSNGTRVLREFDITFNKDANGFLTVNAYGYINGNNSPGVGAGSTNFNIGTTRIGVAPGWAASIADQISESYVRLGNEITSFGLGTSCSMRMYYKRTIDGGYQQTGDQADAGGYNYWGVGGLASNTSYHYFARQFNNNGDTSDGGQQVFKTLAFAVTGTATKLATTFTVPVTVTASQTGDAAPTTKLQYKRVVDATWIDTAGSTSLTPSFTPTGLLPNTAYNYRLVSTNSTGAYTGATSTVTTLPAATLVYSNGVVKNGIPRRVNANGTTTMLNVKRILPS